MKVVVYRSQSTIEASCDQNVARAVPIEEVLYN